MPKPVVAAVNGPAVGIGLSLALAADLVVAAESAYFLLAFVNIGLVPDGGSSLFVPTRVGFARATEMAMLGERIPAAQALEWGLVNRVVPDDAFDGRGRRRSSTGWPPGPTRSYAGTKRQLNHWLYARMEEQLELEADIQQEMAGSRRLRRGRHGLRRRSARRRSKGAESRHLRAVVRRAVNRILAPWPGRPATRRSRRLAFALLVALAALLAFAGAAFADAAHARERRLAQRRRHRHALQARPRHRARRLRRRRGRAVLLAVQVPRAQGRRRRADPRQHAAGDRLDGRRRADPRRAAVVTFVKLGGIRNPPNSGADGLQLADSGTLVASGPTRSCRPTASR